MSTITEIELIKAYVREAALERGTLDPNKETDIPELDIDQEAIEVPAHKHRKLKKADLEALKKRSATKGLDNQTRDQVQAVYKVWSAFAKTLRAIVVKFFDDDLVIKTVYFGKLYVPKLDRAQASQRAIIYQPPALLQNACSSVLKDACTLPFGEAYHFRTTDALFSKEVKLNLANIAKASGQPIPFVESALQGIMDHLVSTLALSSEGKLRFRLNLKVGQLLISSGKQLSFLAEPFVNLLNPSKSTIMTLSQARERLSKAQGASEPAKDDAKSSSLFDERSQRIKVNAETLASLLKDQ